METVTAQTPGVVSDHNQKTLELASQQKDTPLKNKVGSISEARQEVHCTGTSGLKVRKKKQLWQTKPKNKRTATHKERMAARRAAASEDTFGYEGWLDSKLTISLDQVTFAEVVGGILESIRQKINTSRSLFELVVGIDSETLFRYIISTVCCVATVAFAYLGITTQSWIPLVLAGLTAITSIYCVQQEVFKWAIEILHDAVINRYGTRDGAVIIPDTNRQEDRDIAERFMAGEDLSDDGPEFEYQNGDWLGKIGLNIVSDVTQAILVGGIGFVALNKKGRLIDELSKIPRVASGFASLVEIVLKWISDTVDTVFGTDTKSYFCTNQKLDKWAREVIAMADEQDNGVLQVSASTASRVAHLLQAGRSFLADKSITGPSGAAIHRNCMRELEKLQLVHNKSGLGSESKPEPVGIMIRGESGVGKSYTTQRLMKLVGVRLMNPSRRQGFIEDFHSEVWAATAEEEHANGYKNQFFTVLDDLGQQKFAPGTRTEAMCIIRWINSNPQRLNMAALHEKGNVSFTSDVIIASTNRYTFWDMNIVQPEAFLRRWSLIVDMVPKKEWCTPETRDLAPKQRRLDKSRLTAGFNPDTTEIHLQKIVDAAQQTFETEKILSLREFEDLIVETYKKNRRDNSATLASMQEMVQERLAEVEAEERALDYEAGQMDAASSRKPDGTWFGAICSTVSRVKDTFVKRTTATAQTNIAATRALLRNFSNECKCAWENLMGIALERKIKIVAFFAILAGLSVMLFYALKDHLPKAWSTKLKSNEPTVCETIEEILDRQFEDQKAFLESQGLETVSTPDRTLPRRKIINYCQRFGTYVYKQTFLKGDTFSYTLETKYQSGLFAEPAAYSMYNQKFIATIFRRNVYHLYAYDVNPAEKTSAGKVLMVKGKLMLINKHFVSRMRTSLQNGVSGDRCVKFVPHGRVDKAISVPMSHFADDSNVSNMDGTEDAVLVNMSPFMQDHSNLIPKFLQAADSLGVSDHDFTVFSPPNPVTMRQHDVIGRYLAVAKVQGNSHTGMFWYQAPTIKGDCGGLLFDNAATNPLRRLVGIHAAGDVRGDASSKVAFAQHVTQEKLMTWASKFDEPLAARAADEVMEFESNHDTGLDIVRRDKKCNFIATESSLAPSYMHGWAGEPTRVPAVLKPFTNTSGDLVDPLMVALSGEHANNVPIDIDDVEAAVLSTAKAMAPCVMEKGKLLSVEEAIVGIPDTNLKPIQRNTSAGYYGLHNTGIKPGKKGAFGADGDYTLESTESKRLIARVNELWAEAEKGQPPDSPFLVFLKTEKRPRAKVEAGKARLVKAASVDEVIMIRRLYGHLVKDLMSHHTLCGIAVGINPLGPNWDFLAKYLQKKGLKLIAGDFSGFDQSQSGQLLRAVLRIVSILAGHTDPAIKRVEACMAETLAAPRCMIGNMVYQNDHGLPSGNPLTSIMNSIFVHLAFRLVWLRLMRRPGQTRRQSLEEFEAETTLVVYGDDHLINVSDSVCEKFNQTTLIEAFPGLGLKYTSDNKEDTNPPKYRMLEEVTFLKRGFRHDSLLDKWVAPLDLQTLLEVSYYADSKRNPVHVTYTNVDRTIYELALHGQEVYEKWTRKLHEEHSIRSDEVLILPKYSFSLQEVYGSAPGFERGLRLEAVGQA